MKGIDVSEHNGRIDWKEIKNAGIEFVMVRTGYGKSYRDPMFEENVHGAHEQGLQVGAYHYSYALTASDAVKEAQSCKGIIERAGVFLEIPVFYDMEDADGYKSRHSFQFTKRNITKLCKTFIEEMKPLNTGIYVNYDWLKVNINWEKLGVPIWNAEWNSEDDFKGYMWQYTNKLRIGGNEYDGNILYVVDNKT